MTARVSADGRTVHMTPVRRVTTCLPPDVQERLREIAARLGVPMARVLCEAVRAMPMPPRRP
jgi:predicted DNA-binding protein